MIKINETPEKLNPRKRNIQLKNISLHDFNISVKLPEEE